MADLYGSLCRFLATAGGLGDFVVASAADGRKIPADLGAVNTTVYHYYATNGTQFEQGSGAYNAATQTVARTNVDSGSSGDGVKVNFTTAPKVDLFANWTDLTTPEAANLPTAQQAAARASINAAQAFPSGTVMLFFNNAAPIGWTRVTGYSDRLLRINDGTLTAGGSTGFSTWAAQTVVGSHTLSVGEIPFHQASHNVDDGTGGTAYGTTDLTGTFIGAFADNGAGGGGAHNHSVNFDVAYVDMLMASKN